MEGRQYILICTIVVLGDWDTKKRNIIFAISLFTLPQSAEYQARGHQLNDRVFDLTRPEIESTIEKLPHETINIGFQHYIFHHIVGYYTGRNGGILPVKNKQYEDYYYSYSNYYKQMESGSTSDDQKLEYASRLSGLLLNEGTDVLRWFLFDNLPRRVDSAPNLQKVKCFTCFIDW